MSPASSSPLRTINATIIVQVGHAFLLLLHCNESNITEGLGVVIAGGSAAASAKGTMINDVLAVLSLAG